MGAYKNIHTKNDNINNVDNNYPAAVRNATVTEKGSTLTAMKAWQSLDLLLPIEFLKRVTFGVSGA